MMRCIQLGFKLYFLGGQTLMDFEDAKKLKHPLKGNQWGRYHPYPPNVYIFDPVTITIANANANAFDVVTLGPPMNTGKPNPLLLFVTYGKIYALSSPFKRLPNLEYFDVFDPKTNTWAPLPPPPFYEPINMHHALVKRKVYVLWGKHPSWSGFAIHCFDLGKKEWIPSSKLKCPSLHARYSIASFVKNTIYGYFNNTIVAFGPIKDTDKGGDGQFFKRFKYFSQEGLVNSFMLCPKVVDRSGIVIHLENKHFCYVVSGNPPLPALPEDPHPKGAEDLINDPYTLYISLAIFEALSDSFIDKDGESYSKAKFLHSAHFVANTPWDSNLAILRDCFLSV